MKKIIAIVMALVMMMAVTVPAFAADITKDSAQAGQATVATTTNETDATYTVSYPAAFTFAWDDTNAQNANYTVTSQLPIGAKLKVSVVADNNGEMLSANAPDYALEYTLAGGTAEKEFSEINNAAGPDEDITIAIAQSEYDAAVPDVYQGTVTYTVVYAAA